MLATSSPPGEERCHNVLGVSQQKGARASGVGGEQEGKIWVNRMNCVATKRVRNTGIFLFSFKVRVKMSMLKCSFPTILLHSSIAMFVKIIPMRLFTAHRAALKKISKNSATFSQLFDVPKLFCFFPPVTFRNKLVSC